MKLNNGTGKGAGQIKRVLTSFSLTLCFVAMLGCDFKGATELAKMGIETGQTLTAYYESLSQNTNDALEMQMAWAALLEHPAANGESSDDEDPDVSPNKIKRAQERIKSLNNRIQMARQITAMYTALHDYSSYDSGARLGAAADDLAGTLSSLIPIPGAATAATFAGKLIQDLKNINKYNDIKKKIQVGMELVKELQKLYDSESTAYTLIAQDNISTMTALGKALVNREMVLSWQLLDRVPAAFGLK